MRTRSVCFVLGCGLATTLGWPGIAAASEPARPSFDCQRANGSVQKLICSDAELAALDQRMVTVYAAALAKAANQHPPVLKAEQRGWIKGRDDCWKSPDVRVCVHDSYRQRIAELQARYALVAGRGPLAYACNGNVSDELVVTFYPTDPATAIVERGDRSVLMFQQPSASGARYAGPNETFWDKGGEARVTWGYQAPAMSCRRNDD
jgi:uncharacterized protein